MLVAGLIITERGFLQGLLQVRKPDLLALCLRERGGSFQSVERDPAIALGLLDLETTGRARNLKPQRSQSPVWSCSARSTIVPISAGESALSTNTRSARVEAK